jgi:hypothetical protein
MTKILSAIGFIFLFTYWLYKLVYSKQEANEDAHLAALYHEADFYIGFPQLKKLTKLYESRGRALRQLRKLLTEELRCQYIQDRIILAREIARLTVEEADIISDFEIIQQPFIQS